MSKSTSSTSSSSTAEKVFSSRIDAYLVKELRILAAEREETIQKLAEEAFSDLLKKYKKK